MTNTGRRVRLVARGLLAVASLAVGVMNTLADRKLIELSDGKQVVIIVGLALVATTDNARQVVLGVLAPGREAASVRVQKALIGSLLAVAQAKNLEVTHLGSSVFVLRSGLFGRKKLVRRVRFRLAQHPQATEVDWTRGKGTVGECWKTGRKAYHYRRPVADKYGARDLSTTEFASLNPSTTSNFSHDEFLSMVGKYAEVLAVPIKSEGGELLGVVSIDVSVDAPKGQKYLDDRAVEGLVVAGAVALVRDDVGKL